MKFFFKVLFLVLQSMKIHILLSQLQQQHNILSNTHIYQIGGGYLLEEKQLIHESHQ